MKKQYTKNQKMHVRSGDTVVVLSGNDKGKKGKILKMLVHENKAIVEKMRIATKHEKPSAGKPEGGVKKIEMPIHVSNLMLINPADGQPTRIGRKRNEKGKLQRYAKKTGEFIAY